MFTFSGYYFIALICPDACLPQLFLCFISSSNLPLVLSLQEYLYFDLTVHIWYCLPTDYLLIHQSLRHDLFDNLRAMRCTVRRRTLEYQHFHIFFSHLQRFIKVDFKEMFRLEVSCLKALLVFNLPKPPSLFYFPLVL